MESWKVGKLNKQWAIPSMNGRNPVGSNSFGPCHRKQSSTTKRKLSLHIRYNEDIILNIE